MRRKENVHTLKQDFSINPTVQKKKVAPCDESWVFHYRNKTRRPLMEKSSVSGAEKKANVESKVKTMQIDKPTFGLGTNTSVGASNGLA
jgi:hypothetical protein